MKEKVHNAMNLCFSIIGLVSLFFILVIACLKGVIILIVYSSLFIVLMISRVVLGSKVIYSFYKLNKNIDSNNTPFYIAKSWTRKKEGSLWVGISYLVTILLFIVITSITSSFKEVEYSTLIYIILSAHLFIVVIIMFVNLQSMESNIKYAQKRINMNTVEWMQIKADQSNYYKQMFIWYVHSLFIFPLILMAIPQYRNIWNKV